MCVCVMPSWEGGFEKKSASWCILWAVCVLLLCCLCTKINTQKLPWASTDRKRENSSTRCCECVKWIYRLLNQWENQAGIKLKWGAIKTDNVPSGTCQHVAIKPSWFYGFLTRGNEVMCLSGEREHSVSALVFSSLSLSLSVSLSYTHTSSRSITILLSPVLASWVFRLPSFRLSLRFCLPKIYGKLIQKLYICQQCETFSAWKQRLSQCCPVTYCFGVVLN